MKELNNFLCSFHVYIFRMLIVGRLVFIIGIGIVLTSMLLVVSKFWSPLEIEGVLINMNSFLGLLGPYLHPWLLWPLSHSQCANFGKKKY